MTDSNELAVQVAGLLCLAAGICVSFDEDALQSR